MIDFKQFYKNGRGWMFWNTLMLLLNKLQIPKEEYAKKAIIKAYDEGRKDVWSSNSKYAFRDGKEYYKQEF